MRGVGSLYYLMFAISHGLPEPLAMQLIQLTLIVVTHDQALGARAKRQIRMEDGAVVNDVLNLTGPHP